MTTNITPTVYPKDLTMSLESNHVQNEVREFSTEAERIFVPNGGPFFTDSLVIQAKSGRHLRPITEYQILYLNEQATKESGKNVSSVIRILNNTITSITLSYRVIGGEYSNTIHAIKQDLLRGGNNDRVLDWNKNVYNKPSEYPPAPHFHTGDDFTDWDHVWWQLINIKDAILVGDKASWDSVYNYFDRKLTQVKNEIMNGLGTRARDIASTQLMGYLLTSEFNAYKSTIYSKTEVDDKLATINNNIDGVSAVANQAKNKTDELSSKLNLLDGKVGEAKGKVSAESGNLLTMKSDGIYYTIPVPVDRSNIYVDCVNGDDRTGNGTKESPYKTLHKALSVTPVDLTNTIWLKVIPTEYENTHYYELNRDTTISGGAVRNFNIYGHDLLDGEGFEETKKRGSTINHFVDERIPCVPIYMRQVYWASGNNKYSRIRATFRLSDNATVNFTKCDLIHDFVNDDKQRDNYRANGSVTDNSTFSGNGNVGLIASKIIKLLPNSVKTEDFTTDPNAVIFQPWYNSDYIVSVWNQQNINIVFHASKFGYGYAANENLNDSGIRGGKVTFDTRFENSADLKGFELVHGGSAGYPLKSGGKPLIRILGGRVSITVQDSIHGGVGSGVTASGGTFKPGTMQAWFKNYEVIQGVEWHMGIPLNVDSNVRLTVSNKRHFNYGKSESIPVGGLFITTTEYANGAAVATELGYGRWERYAKGMALVGVDPDVRSSRANNVLAWWQKIGNTFGSYTTILNNRNLPPHRHSRDNIWNKFIARASDITNPTSNTGTSVITNRNDVHIGTRSNAEWTASTESSLGGNIAINNVQPSIAVGVWIRLPDQAGNDPSIPVAYDNNVPDFMKTQITLINDTDIRNMRLSLHRHDVHISSNRNINISGFGFATTPAFNNTTNTNRVFMYLNNKQATSQRLQSPIAVPPSEYARAGTGVVTGDLYAYEYNEFGQVIDYNAPPPSVNTETTVTSRESSGTTTTTATVDPLAGLPDNYKNALIAAHNAELPIVDLGGGTRAYEIGSQVISQRNTGSAPYPGATDRRVYSFETTVVNDFNARVNRALNFSGFPATPTEHTAMLDIVGGEARGSVVFFDSSAKVPYNNNPAYDYVQYRSNKNGITGKTPGQYPNETAYKVDYYLRRTVTNNASLNAPDHDVVNWYLLVPKGYTSPNVTTHVNTATTGASTSTITSTTTTPGTGRTTTTSYVQPELATTTTSGGASSPQPANTVNTAGRITVNDNLTTMQSKARNAGPIVVELVSSDGTANSEIQKYYLLGNDIVSLRPEPTSLDRHRENGRHELRYFIEFRPVRVTSLVDVTTLPAFRHNNTPGMLGNRDAVEIAKANSLWTSLVADRHASNIIALLVKNDSTVTAIATHSSDNSKLLLLPNPNTMIDSSYRQDGSYSVYYLLRAPATERTTRLVTYTDAQGMSILS